MSHPVFHSQKRAMTWTIWPVSSLQHWTWCYDYTLHCRSDMPGMKGWRCVWDVEVQNFLSNTWQSPAPSCAVPIKPNISDRDDEAEEDSWKHAHFSCAVVTSSTHASASSHSGTQCRGRSVYHYYKNIVVSLCGYLVLSFMASLGFMATAGEKPSRFTITGKK